MHKKAFARTRYLVFILGALYILRGEFPAQEFRTVHDGVEYAQAEHKLGSDPVKMNLLRLDLTKVRLDVKRATDSATGRETTSSIAARHGATAGINAGFFRLDNSYFAGETVGTLVIDGVVQSENLNRRSSIVFGNSKSTKVLIGNFETVISIHTEDQTSPNSVAISGVNREAKEDEVILYTDFFRKAVPLPTGATALSLSRCRADVTKSYFKEPFTLCRALRKVTNSKEYIIPKAEYLILIGSKAEEGALPLIRGLNSTRRAGKIRRKYGLFHYFRDGGAELYVDRDTDLVAGLPRLIKNGVIDVSWEIERANRSFAESRHPRTAVAKLKDGKFLMMTVDGRQPGVSVGMTLQELAEYLLSLGAVDAMNLDGGGSTTMVLNGKVVNTPSDKEGERKVGDAILVTLRKGSAARKR